MNTAALNVAADTVRRVGEVAEMIGNAVQPLAEIDAKKVRKARRSLRSAGAAAWASLLDRLF